MGALEGGGEGASQHPGSVAALHSHRPALRPVGDEAAGQRKGRPHPRVEGLT